MLAIEGTYPKTWRFWYIGCRFLLSESSISGYIGWFISVLLSNISVILSHICIYAIVLVSGDIQTLINTEQFPSRSRLCCLVLELFRWDYL